MTAISATVLEADVAAVEAHEANLGSVVSAILDDGVTAITMLMHGATFETSMFDAGEAPKMADVGEVRKSEFARVGKSPLSKDDVITIGTRQWRVTNRSEPDNIVYRFQLAQNW
jgi:hypothetical protein